MPYRRQKETPAIHFHGKRQGFREDFTPCSRQQETPAIHFYGKRRGFHALQPTAGDPSDTVLWKTSRISRLTADRRKPQRYTSMENVKDFTPYSRQKETPAIHFYGKRRGFHALQPANTTKYDKTAQQQRRACLFLESCPAVSESWAAVLSSWAALQKETPAIHYHGKRRGFHALQPTEGDPSDTLPWKTSRISRRTARKHYKIR